MDDEKWNRNCILQFFNFHNGCGTVPAAITLLECDLF